MKPPLSVKEAEERVRRILVPGPPDEVVRARLEELSGEAAFRGLTWLWGPELYGRNRVLFRPFILNSFASWAPGGLFTGWGIIPWKGEVGSRLDRWLAAVDANDDVELFRRLIVWKLSDKNGRIDHALFRRELLARHAGARDSASRFSVLARFDAWFELDEATATELWLADAAAARPFIKKHLPVRWAFLSEKRELWAKLHALAVERGDHELERELYRRQIPIDRWRQDALAFCDQLASGEELCRRLEDRHPRGYGLDLGEPFFELVVRRGRDVVPYVLRHLRDVWGGWLRKGFDRILDHARQQGWDDLWAGLLKVCARPKEYNREVLALVDDRARPDPVVRSRLLLLTGVSREWNFPGLSVGMVRQLDDDTAVRLHERFPELMRGPFRMHVASSGWAQHPKLLERVIATGDEPLIDYLASRLATLVSWGENPKPVPGVDRCAAYFEGLRASDPEGFSRRAIGVLTQVPAYSIHLYGHLVRHNRLARLLFERSASSYLADGEGLSDLVEAAEIHVQALAYRALGLDDDRARECAARNLDVLMGTLLRPLHRTTRVLAFGALANAATTIERARAIHERARQALELPDRRYPKERLVGLIGRLLDRWPELAGPRERPVVYRRATA